MDLYRGHLLDGLLLDSNPLFDEWLTILREALTSRALIALNLLIGYYERRGNYHLARQCANQMVTLAPWEESARHELMRLLAQDGQWSAAAAQYHACRRYLMDELALEPSQEMTRLFEKIRSLAAQNQLLPPRIPICPNNLPRIAMPFVGRENELDMLIELLSEPNCRLITLLGPGGIGKTRLALEVANQQLGIFQDGVFFVQLDSAQISSQVIALIGNALELSFPEQQQPVQWLLQFLRQKNILLVLDGVEHVAKPTEQVLSEILPALPNLVVLVTSQEKLNLHEEQVYEVDGLVYPKEEISLTTAEASQYDAMILFLERVQQVKRDFDPSSHTLKAIAKICQILDGHPLGIELAAAAVWSRSCQEIAGELAENLDTLTSEKINVPERHRSLRAVFDHSYSLLTSEEKSSFLSLGLFKSSFDQTAVKAIAGIDWNTLAAFLDKSLLRRDEFGRYQMHDLIRSFTLEILIGRTEQIDRVRGQHIRYYSEFIQRRAEELSGAGQQNAIFDLALEIDNWQQACLWAAQLNLSTEIDLCLDTIYYYFEIHSRFQEGIQLFGKIISLLDCTSHPKLHARLLARQAAHYYRIASYDLAEINLIQAMEILDESEDLAEFAFCLVKQASIASRRGEFSQAKSLAEKSLRLAQEVGEFRVIGAAQYLLGLILYRAGNAREAQSFLQASQEASQVNGDKRLWGEAANLLGDIACHEGDFELAKQLFEENLILYQALGDKLNMTVVLNNLGTIWHIQKDYAKAEQAYQRSLAIAREIGDQTQQAIELSNLGELAQIQGFYQLARQHYEQGLRIGQLTNSIWVVMACLNNLGEVSCTLQEFSQAKLFLSQALKTAQETQTTTMLIKVLVNLGEYFWKTDQASLAAEIWEVARHHPACELDIRNRANAYMVRIALPVQKVETRSLEELLQLSFATLNTSSKEEN